MKENHDEEKQGHHCNICSKIIKGSHYKYQCHLYKHNVVKPKFQCEWCLKEYFRRDLYMTHLSQHNVALKRAKQHYCDDCGRGFVNKRNLASHLRIHDNLFIEPKTGYKCLACGANYCEERLLQHHVRKVHKDNNHQKRQKIETWIEPLKGTEVLVEMTKIKDNKLLIRKYTDTSKIKSDILTTNTSNRSNSKFSKYIKLVLESKEPVHYSKVICDYCNKEMLKKSLPSHIRQKHLKLRPFKCEECKKTFQRHYQLTNHNCGFRKRKAVM